MQRKNEERSSPASGSPNEGGLAAGEREELPVPQGDVRMALGRDMASLNHRKSRLDQMKASARSDSSSFRQEMLGAVFAVLRDAGVDPSNLASVSAFMRRLEQTDPDMVVLLMTALDGLSSGLPEREGAMPQGAMPQEPENPVTERMEEVGMRS